MSARAYNHILRSSKDLKIYGQFTSNDSVRAPVAPDSILRIGGAYLSDDKCFGGQPQMGNWIHLVSST